ncbi:Holliday junction resolvase RecU [Atopococcus tabaci]|uniref:Holliday junction resolvase RecU n=1 Tax=Atopococcus tabaci TaxID=269774 RepID=UPI00240A3E46|nr:Holliday junction resolvase RecU [Atopococcus tabaci]
MRNRTTGRKQQASGKEFEDQLERIHKWYAQQGIAMISKVPTATKAIPHGKGVRWIPAEKTGCDYLGVYRGKAVALEAKQSSTATRWDLFARGKNNADKKVVADHQQRYLLKHKECGGLAYVIIKIKPTQSLYRLDIEDYIKLEQEALQAGRKSVPIGQLERYKVVIQGRMPDYLRE